MKQGKDEILFQNDDAESEPLDAQELLVELSKLRVQAQAAATQCKKLEDDNKMLRQRVEGLESERSELRSKVGVMERREAHCESEAHAHVKVDGDPGMKGLHEGDAGYWEAKAEVLEKRLVTIAKSEYWLRAELAQKKDEVSEARRRQDQAEASVGELLRERGELIRQCHLAQAEHASTSDPHANAQGSAIFDEEHAFAEGLPKTIPARAARYAGLIATALNNSTSLRGSVGRTVCSASSTPSAGPSARPGNLWATLMHGGAAGNKIDFS